MRARRSCSFWKCLLDLFNPPSSLIGGFIEEQLLNLSITLIIEEGRSYAVAGSVAMSLNDQGIAGSYLPKMLIVNVNYNTELCTGRKLNLFWEGYDIFFPI